MEFADRCGVEQTLGRSDQGPGVHVIETSSYLVIAGRLQRQDGIAGKMYMSACRRGGSHDHTDIQD